MKDFRVRGQQYSYYGASFWGSCPCKKGGPSSGLAFIDLGVCGLALIGYFAYGFFAEPNGDLSDLRVYVAEGRVANSKCGRNVKDADDGIVVRHSPLPPASVNDKTGDPVLAIRDDAVRRKVWR